MLKNFSHRKLTILIISLAAVGLVSAASYVKVRQVKPTPTKSTEPNVVNKRPASSDSNQSQNTTPATNTTTKPTPAAPTSSASLPKPSLLLSSGTIPAGQPEEFTCKSSPGLRCTILLTDKTNAAHIIDLGAKTIVDDGYGQTTATWDWSALQGSWSVVAKVTDSNGISAQSNAQDLTVQ